MGECLVEPQRERVVIDGETHHLEPKVMQVLVELAANAQSTVTREQLLNSVWSDAVVGEEVLSRAISLLRSTLGDERTDPKYIRTLPRRGYELILPVEPLPHADTSRLPVKTVVVAVGAVVVIVLVAAFGYLARFPDSKVMVLMPVKVAQADLGGLANGLNDALHNMVSTGRGVEVVARSWSFAVRDPNVGVQGIAEQFGADYVLEGALTQAARQYELALELVDAANGRSVWARQFSAADAQALSGKVLDELRGALNQRVGAGIDELPAARAPLNEEAYRAYLQARYHWSLRGGEHIGRAQALLERVIELDPGFAAARLALAQVVALEPFYTQKPVLEHFALARAHLNTAVQADPSLRSQAQALEGFMRLRARDWAGAQESLRAALAGDPNNALAHYWMSMLLGAVGDYPGSRDYAQNAVDLQPATPVLRDRLAVTHLWMNDMAAAKREFVRAEELGFALDFRSMAYVLYLYRAGQFDELATTLTNLRLPGDWAKVFARGLEASEQRAAAVQASVQAIESGEIPFAFHFGIWVLLQEPGRALAAYNYGLKSDYIEFLSAPECEILQSQAGFEPMLAELGLSDDLIKDLEKQRLN